MKKRMKQRQIIEAYSYQEIVNAGNYLAVGEGHFEEIDIVYWWRNLHAKPLQHLFCSLCGVPNVFVAQRLKRLASMKQKLLRNKKLTLWDMQDVGGCRVVADSMTALKEAVSHNVDMSYARVRRSNYIKNPKKDGYRGIHRVYRYDPYFDNLPEMYFEVQYRTSLQHLWATAVETMSAGEEYDLKAGEGPEYIKRFFVLASSLFALKEGQPVVPGTQNDKLVLLTELADINASHSVLDRLAAKYTESRNYCFEVGFDSSVFPLFCLDEKKRKLDVYEIRDMEKALNAYDVAETNRGKNVVLTRVWGAAMQQAYPNYFMDASRFISSIRSIAREAGVSI